MAAPDKTSDIWTVFNEFLLRGSPDRFTKILARYELFKHVVDLPGDIIECGVFKGTGLLYWAKLLQIFNPLSDKKVVGFDLFGPRDENSTYDWDAQFGAHVQENLSPEAILEIAAEQGLSHRVEIVAGDAARTVPDYCTTHPGSRIALLNLDFDNYDPTAVALNHFFPLVVPGGVVVFDDYAIAHWGESIAVDEYFQGKNYVFKSFPWALSPKAYLIKRDTGPVSR